MRVVGRREALPRPAEFAVVIAVIAAVLLAWLFVRSSGHAENGTAIESIVDLPGTVVVVDPGVESCGNGSEYTCDRTITLELQTSDSFAELLERLEHGEGFSLAASHDDDSWTGCRNSHGQCIHVAATNSTVLLSVAVVRSG